MLLKCEPENHSLFQMIQSLNIPIEGKNILFTGSHDYIEFDIFEQLKPNVVHLFECNPICFSGLEDRIKGREKVHKAHFGCLWSESNLEKEFYFYRNSYDGAGSLYKEKDFNKYAPDCVRTGKSIKLKTITLDDYVEDIGLPDFHVWILDLQGSELDCFRGGKSILNQPTLEWIICETSNFECYSGQPLDSDITTFLSAYGFEKLGIRKDWTGENDKVWHGDTIYRRTNAI